MRQLLKLTILVVVALAFSGCAAKRPEPLPRGEKASRPPASRTYPSDKTYPSGKKVPATQRPYTIKGTRYEPLATADGYVETGLASWYGKQFHGRKTSNGETYNMYGMTAAHKTLPMNTWVKVENLDNGRDITVRVNDRGPFVRGRIIDLTYTGADKIGMLGPGTANVKVTALGEATSYAKADPEAPVAFKPVDYWSGNFTVQVGAFKVKTNAENYRLRLSKTYINAHIVPYEDDRGQFYRVRIGKFAKLTDAEAFADQLMKEGFAAAYAVGE